MHDPTPQCDAIIALEISIAPTDPLIACRVVQTGNNPAIANEIRDWALVHRASVTETPAESGDQRVFEIRDVDGMHAEAVSGVVGHTLEHYLVLYRSRRDVVYRERVVVDLEQERVSAR